MLLNLWRDTMEHLQKTNQELAIVYGMGRLLEGDKPLPERLMSGLEFLTASLDGIQQLVFYENSLYWDEYQPIVSLPGMVSLPALPRSHDLVLEAENAPGAIGFRSQRQLKLLDGLGPSWRKWKDVGLIPLPDKEGSLKLLGFLLIASQRETPILTSGELLMFNAIAYQLAEVIGRHRRDEERKAQNRLNESRTKFPL